MKREDIRIRDPYVLAHENVYYMYASTETSECASADKSALNMLVYKSCDLENWSDPEVVFEYKPSETSHLLKELWAPEVHYYKGRFYAFLSFMNRTGKRGTYVAVADKPDGEFKLLRDEPITPIEQSCIDATLYIENNEMYAVYSHDWPDNYINEKNAFVGEICAVKINDSFERISEPIKLFASCDVPISARTPNFTKFQGREAMRFGSDAPFLLKLSDGRLLLTWSPKLNNNYVVLGAISDSGSLLGEWRHIDEPIFDDNGGHAMFFNDFNGDRIMCIHHPEVWYSERMYYTKVEETDNGVKVVKK